MIQYPIRIADPGTLQKFRDLVDAANQASKDIAELREDIATIDGGTP